MVVFIGRACAGTMVHLFYSIGMGLIGFIMGWYIPVANHSASPNDIHTEFPPQHGFYCFVHTVPHVDVSLETQALLKNDARPNQVECCMGGWPLDLQGLLVQNIRHGNKNRRSTLHQTYPPSCFNMNEPI